jgi:hypothetical protein
MKMTSLLSLLLLLMAAARAEDPKGGQALMESQSTRKESDAKKAKVAPAKPAANEILGKRVTYGGYFTDWFKAEKKRPFFNLKTPSDPQKDHDNLSYYPGTDQVQGVVLFSIKF